MAASSQRDLFPTSSRITRGLLAIGLAFVFAYAGVESLRNPNGWVGFIPNALTHVAAATTILKVTAFVEIILAVWLATMQWLKYASVVATLMLLGIIVGNPHAWDITFRDVGLLAAALALLFS
jgi:uncharacterized membrane protein YphA (DoxX/SURF4 family)